jgi:arsenate reductase (glutaredoxin)
MEVQIFGTRGCAETRKAERFFKERRIKIHFVDLKQKPASPGELRRFEQKFGAAALLDREGKRFRDRGLHVSHIHDSRIMALLEGDALLLRTPLIRSGNVLGVGWDEAVWRQWAQAGG